MRPRRGPSQPPLENALVFKARALLPDLFLNFLHPRSSNDPTDEEEHSPSRPPDADAGLRLVQPRHPLRRAKGQPRHLPSLHRSLVRQAAPLRRPAPGYRLAASCHLEGRALSVPINRQPGRLLPGRRRVVVLVVNGYFANCRQIEIGPVTRFVVGKHDLKVPFRYFFGLAVEMDVH